MWVALLFRVMIRPNYWTTQVALKCNFTSSNLSTLYEWNLPEWDVQHQFINTCYPINDEFIQIQSYQTTLMIYFLSLIFIVETMSEAVKILKGEYVIQALEEHKMDKALIFCRTKLDCDNLEKYLQQRGGGIHPS